MPPTALVLLDDDDIENERTPAIVHYERGIVLMHTDDLGTDDPAVAVGEDDDDEED